MEEMRKASLFAVVIDVSSCFLLEGKNKFALKLKIIDDTFNANLISQKTQKKFQKFASVVFVSSQLEELPKNVLFGDILRLRRFFFKTIDDGQLIAYDTSVSNWFVLGLENGEIKQGKIKKPMAQDGSESILRTQIRDFMYYEEQTRFKKL